MTIDHNQDVSCASISVPGVAHLLRRPSLHCQSQLTRSQLKCKVTLLIQTDGRLIFLAELPRLPTFQLIAIPIKIQAPV